MANEMELNLNSLTPNAAQPKYDFAIIGKSDLPSLSVQLKTYNSRRTLTKDTYVIFAIKKVIENNNNVSKILAEGFKSNELIGPYSNTYGTVGPFFIYNKTAYSNLGNRERFLKTFVTWVHTLQESDYAKLCTKGKDTGGELSFTIVMVDWTGYYTILSGTDFTKCHRSTSFKNELYDISFNLGFESNISGFFFRSGYISKGKQMQSSKTYFLYRSNILTSVLAPTDATTVYSKYNSYDKNKGIIVICQCQNSIQETGGYYSRIENINDLKVASDDLNSTSIVSAAAAGALAATIDYFNAYESLTYSQGNTIEPRSYIPNLEAYKLKFLQGIDNTGVTGNIVKTVLYNDNEIGKNNIYVQLDNSKLKDFTETSNYEIKSIIEQTSLEDLSDLGKEIDTIQTALLNASNIDMNYYKPSHILRAYDNTGEIITLETFFNERLDDGNNYKLKYYNTKINSNNKLELGDEDTSFNSFLTFLSDNIEVYKNFSSMSFNADLFIDTNEIRNSFNLISLEMFEAYTRGRDFLEENYTEVRPQEKGIIDVERKQTCNSNYFNYKYTGRNFSLSSAAALVHECDLLMDSDVTLGETYGKQTYFVEAIKYKDGNDYVYKDTFGVKNILDAIDGTKYTEDDYEIIDGIIDLNYCEFYKPEQATYENNWCDCCYADGAAAPTASRECYYQKSGKCPYRFTTEKHPRRIRTLEQSKSNRFNLIQELSKTFECYPQFNIEHDTTGKVLLDDNGQMKKHISFITEKGAENYSGFRYEKNLSSMSRSVDSSQITTKLYVETVDSDLTETSICSIQTAPDNIGKNAYLLDFSYYTNKGLLNKKQTQRDIWGIDSTDMAFLPRIGLYNERYDELSNLIINLQNKEMTELEASNEVSITGVTTALEERKKIAQKMYQFKVSSERFSNNTYTTDYTLSDTYLSYLTKYKEQATILFGLLEDLFFTKDIFTLVYIHEDQITSEIIDLNKVNSSISETINKYKDKYCKGELFWRLEFEGFENDSTYTPCFNNWLDFKEKVLDKYLEVNTGKFGQYVKLYNQVKYWKKERQKVLNKINDISEQFYKIYEPYIKEGTWTDSNYLTDNEYYWAANSVLSDSCKPQITYSFKIIDISPLKEYEDDYEYDIADTTFVEDIDFFGASPITGLPNHQKVLISAITEYPDTSQENQIEVQNYSSQFDDLFEQITASVQSLTYNENTYKRASNFTAKQYIQSDSLQGTLDQGNLTLVDANDSNIILDDSGTQGNGITNKSSQYKLSGEGLFFSKDGGETWDIGVGPEGYNLDYAKFGQLDASKVQIIDGEYIYFLWDKNGINAYRNPSNSTSGLVDFARFNRYGLSLIENNHVRLRAGYEFKTTSKGKNPNGDYRNEINLKDQNVGFYLYNDSGQPIFKTETASEYNDTTTDYSARLSLQGEMFITNTNLSDDGIQNGSIISKSQGSKLQIGYIFEEIKAGQLSNTIFSKALNQNKTLYATLNNTDLVSEIVVPHGDNLNCVVYKYSSRTAFSGYSKVVFNNRLVDINNNLYKYDIEAYNTTITNNGNSDITITDFQKIIDKNIPNCNIVYSQSQSLPIIYHNGAYYEANDTRVKILQEINNSANYTVSEVLENSQTNVTYYDDEGQPYTKTLYFYTAAYDLTIYSYWEKSTNVDIDNGTTSISTDEVIVYLNNKLLNQQNENSVTYSTAEDTGAAATEGAERILMIGLRGNENNKSVYRNLLSVLKNGILYVGGEIRDKSGSRFNNIPVGQIPDKVKIVGSSLIVANNGYTWMDWKKTFGIIDGKLTTPDENGNGSLYSLLFNLYDALSNSSSNSSGKVEKDGYYLEEPFE